MSTRRKEKFFCKDCMKEFKSNETYQNHLKSKKHAEKIRKRSEDVIEEEKEPIEYLSSVDDITICLFCCHKHETLEEYFN